jgi:hypothetical protein
MLGEEEPAEEKPRRGIAKILLPVAALILVGAAVGLYIAFRKPAELEVWDLIPRNAIIVGKIDAKKMKGAQAPSEGMGQLGPGVPGAATSALGFEQTLKDADAIYIAAVPGRGAGAEPASLALFETLSPINEQELIAQLQNNQTIAAPVQIEGKNAYPIKPPEELQGKAPEQMLVVLRKNIMAVGTRPVIQESVRLASRTSTASAKDNQNLMALCDRVNQKKALWIVGSEIGQLLAQAAPPGVGLGGGMEAIKNFLLECDWSDATGFSADALLECASADTAASTAQQLQGMVAMFALPLGLGEDAIKVTSTASNVKIAVVLSPEKLAELEEKMGAMKMPPMGPGMPGMEGIEGMEGLEEGGGEMEFPAMEEGEESEILKELMKKRRETEEENSESELE